MARKINASSVSILAVGHALVLGARGEAGGAPSKDSIWGIARCNKELVTFSGRREGKLRIKVEKATEDQLMVLFKAKKAGVNMSYSYQDVTKKHEKVLPGLAARIADDFNEAQAAGKISQRKLPLISVDKLKESLKAMKMAATAAA